MSPAEPPLRLSGVDLTLPSRAGPVDILRGLDLEVVSSQKLFLSLR